MARHEPTPADFRVYFDIADELAGGCTLDDLRPQAVKQARRATALGLPWPPSLVEAEEYMLANIEWVRGRESR